MIQQEYRQAISDLSHNLIPLTDAFGYTDRQLNTALGRGDGRAYEALWEAAQKNPINCDEVQRTRLAVSVHLYLYLFIDFFLKIRIWLWKYFTVITIWNTFNLLSFNKHLFNKAYTKKNNAYFIIHNIHK